MKNRSNFQKTFFRQKPIIMLFFTMRLFIIVGCITFIGAKIFSITQPSRSNKTLFDAVQAGDKVKVRELLLAGCNPDPLDEERNTPLYFTSFNVLYSDEYLEIMKLLLAFYANVDQQNYRGETTLHGCVRIENFEKLKIAFSTLLSYGANIFLEDRDGNSMLDELVRIDTMGAIDILLGSYADIFGIDAINRAIKKANDYHYTDIIDYVLEKYRKQIQNKLFSPPKSRQLSDQLAAVITRNHTFFQQKEPKVDDNDSFGNNQLHLAVMIGDTALVETLLKKSKKLALRKNHQGSFPLHFISRAGNSIETRKRMLEIFEKHEVDINQQDGTKSTLLHILVRKRDFSLLQYALHFFGEKINRNIKDNNDETIKDLIERLDRDKLSLLH